MITFDATQIFTIIGGIFDKKYQHHIEEAKNSTEIFSKSLPILGEIAKKVLEHGWNSKTLEEYRECVKNSDELSDKEKFAEYERIKSMEDQSRNRIIKGTVVIVLAGGITIPLGIWASKTGRGLCGIPNFMLNNAGKAIKTVFC